MNTNCVLSYSWKFLSYHHQMEHWNHVMFQRGRLCETSELMHMPLIDATEQNYEQKCC